MKFGIASLFAFRPHVEHLVYLAELLRRDGHAVSGFTCDSAVSHCYSRDLRGRSRLRQCPECVIGGIRSFAIDDVWSIDRRLQQSLEPQRLHRLTLSSVATVLRTEAVADLKLPEFTAAQRDLHRPVETVYANAKRWIEDCGLDAVLFFNGRMDLTAALRAACEDLQRPFITVERSWFGHGLNLVPNENSIALGEVGRLCEEFRERPLLPEQAAFAGRIAADRFRQRNALEWRLYNAAAITIGWPNAAPRGARVLILPGSRNEFEGHPDFACQWEDYTVAIDQVLAHLGLQPRNCVLRCHPNWAEPIGRNTGWRSEQHWVSWAERHGMSVIRSADRSSTYGLIGEADCVIVNGSSAGVDAGLRGRKVVCVGHSTYERAGFSIHLGGPSDLPLLEALAQHDSEGTSRRALRYIYTYGRRFNQFSRFVRAVTTLRYQYFEGADPRRIVRICKLGRLDPDDCEFADDARAESQVVARMLAGEWDSLAQWEEAAPASPQMNIRRRFGLRWVDDVRELFPRGDL